MRLRKNIDEKYDLLTANEKEVLNQILREKERARGMNSVQLAKFCHVSRTTLFRLFKKLEISSFAEFQLLLAEEQEKRGAFSFDMQEIVENYHRMIDELKRYDYREICQKLFLADTIYIYGTGNEQKAIGEEFKRIFLSFGKFCVDLYDFGEIQLARRNFRPGDVFLAISLSGESRGMGEIMRLVQETEATTISLTRWENNTLSRMCQYSLYVGTRTIKAEAGQSYEMVAMFYIMLDILSVRYLEYAKERAEEENED